MSKTFHIQHFAFPKIATYMVCVSKSTEDKPFRTKVTYIPRGTEVMMPLGAVLVHVGDNERQIFKSYTVYLECEDRDIAKKDGVEIIKKYRKEVEGL